MWTFAQRRGRDASPQASADGSEIRPYLFKSPIPNGNWHYSILNRFVAGNKTEGEPLMDFAFGEIH